MRTTRKLHKRRSLAGKKRLHKNVKSTQHAPRGDWHECTAKLVSSHLEITELHRLVLMYLDGFQGLLAWKRSTAERITPNRRAASGPDLPSEVLRMFPCSGTPPRRVVVANRIHDLRGQAWQLSDGRRLGEVGEDFEWPWYTSHPPQIVPLGPDQVLVVPSTLDDDIDAPPFRIFSCGTSGINTGQGVEEWDKRFEGPVALLTPTHLLASFRAGGVMVDPTTHGTVYYWVLGIIQVEGAQMVTPTAWASLERLTCTVALFDLSTGEVLARVPCPPLDSISIQLVREGLLLCGSELRYELVCFMSPASATSTLVNFGFDGSMSLSVVTLPQQELIVAALRATGHIHVCDATGQVLRVLKGPKDISALLVGLGDDLVVAVASTTITVWHTTTGHKTFALRGGKKRTVGDDDVLVHNAKLVVFTARQLAVYD